MISIRRVEQSKHDSQSRSIGAADAAAQMIAGMAGFADLEPAQMPQRRADLVHERAHCVRLRSDALEGENSDRGALEHSRKNERRLDGLRAFALASPQRCRRAFTIAAKVSGRKAPEMREAAARGDVS